MWTCRPRDLLGRVIELSLLIALPDGSVKIVLQRWRLSFDLSGGLRCRALGANSVAAIVVVVVDAGGLGSFLGLLLALQKHSHTSCRGIRDNPAMDTYDVSRSCAVLQV